jgi:competence protein ComGD
MQMLITRNRTFFYSYTLIETVFVLVVTLGMFIFPVFSVASWQKQMAIEQFFYTI